MKGQLDVFNQFAPAVTKLAQATELNTRKQYEQKALTNKELKDFVARVVKKMRDWQYREQIEEQEQSNKSFSETSQLYMAHLNDAPNSTQSQELRQQTAKMFANNVAARRELDLKFEREFDTDILADAVIARNELINKLGISQEPELGQMNKYALLVFQGKIVGANPVSIAAEYLEQFARKQSP
jgi:hypothetical protein